MARTATGDIMTESFMHDVTEKSGAQAPSPVAESHRLPIHLKRLEAESIEIMREVVAEFKNPVMLYSIGKDSAVMVRLAMKAYSTISMNMTISTFGMPLYDASR